MKKRFILLGASRGLGWSTYEQLRTNSDYSFVLSSRKIKMQVDKVDASTQLIEQDFSKLPLNQDFLLQLQNFAPTDLIYFAGGGPY